MLFTNKSATNYSPSPSEGAERAGASSTGSITKAYQIKDILQVVETAESERFIGDLFRRKFGGDPPDFPKHFVALYSRDGITWQAVGYVNFWPRNRAFMGGGLVIEDRIYRQMPAPHRALIKSSGGIAEHLLRTSLHMLPANDVVWGYVGDTRAEKVDLRVGFVHTHIDRIIAYWTREPGAEEKLRLTEEIATVGPF